MPDAPDPFDLDALRNLPRDIWGHPRFYEADRVWADGFETEIRRILRDLAGYLGYVVDIRAADEEADMHRAEDYVIEMTTGRLAARIRKPNCRQRDLTIRFSRPSGVTTEYQKIIEGKGPRWYLYAWARDDHAFKAVAIIDIQRLLERGLLDNPDPIPNGDGTTFIALPMWDISHAGAVIWCDPPIVRLLRGEAL